jgi:hypothetical protein
MAGAWAGRGCVSGEIQVKTRTLLTAGAAAAVAPYTASGLPGGLSINKSTGVISAVGAAQTITFAANTELLVVGDCVTGATTAFLEPCIGATSQEWTRQSNGEYVLKSNGKCLTAPSANNGTQLALAACANTANQHWAVP